MRTASRGSGPDDKPRRELRVLPQAGADSPRAWEEVEAGRYMPRRIRGSFRGRELG